MTQLSRRFALGALLLFGFGGAHAQVVISQVYGGGGNSGATLKSDFIELRNNGASAVDVSGWSVQYASSTGSTWSRTNLTGSISAGGYYLVKEGDGAGGTVDLPTPDATGTIAMAGTSGKVALVSSQTSLSGACPLGAPVLDLVGYGSANCSETAPTPSLSNTTAAIRNGNGATDTDNNSADFTRDSPNPRNSSDGPPPPPPTATALTIGQIQGAGAQSSHVDERVVTHGVVTALKFNNGFFLQSTGEDVDADPATSEGVFVFTGSAPAVALGDQVEVIATVKEFTPGSNLNQLTITELVSPTINVLSSGNPLPPAVVLTAAELNATNTPGTLEHLEGMRVSVTEAWVVEGAEGNISEANATATTTGVFQVVLPEIVRPFREPGIGLLDAIPIPPGKNPPRFDTNQERLMVRSRGQVGAAALAVDAGSVVIDLIGVLDYFSGTWALLPDTATPPSASAGKLPTAVSEPGGADVTIGGFNLLRFFDDVNDPGVGDVVLTAVALDKRLTKTSAAICDYLKAPDILGVVEVENINVLSLLAQRINDTCARAPAYVPYLEQGNDVGGINVGFLVSTRDIGGNVARVDALQVTQFGKVATIPNPDASTAILNDRPPLLLRAVVHQPNGASYPVTVIVNHLRSLNGVDDTSPGSSGWATTGHRVRAKRAAQASYLAGLVEQFQQDNPAEKIVLVGDFNAFEFNDGYVDVMGIVRGEEAAEDQVLTYVDSPITTPLIDGSALIADPGDRYSYVFAGSAQTLDHVVVNEALVMDAFNATIEHARINADFGVHHFGEAGNALRVSDHDPVRLSVQVPAFLSADLSTSLAGPQKKLHYGRTERFPLQLTNTGPQDAWRPVVVVRGDAPAANVHIVPPSGWTCLTRSTTDGFALRCESGQALPAGASIQFEPEILIPARPDSTQFLTLDAVVGAQSTDPDLGNNNAHYQNRIVGVP